MDKDAWKDTTPKELRIPSIEQAEIRGLCLYAEVAARMTGQS